MKLLNLALKYKIEILAVLVAICIACCLKCCMGREGFASMSDMSDSSAFGTTADRNLRWQNLTVRPEAWGAPGDVHACKCGPPSKLDVDRSGSNHGLFHVCDHCEDDDDEPSQLGHRWQTADGCDEFDSGNIGLSRRPVAGNQFGK